MSSSYQTQQQERKKQMVQQLQQLQQLNQKWASAAPGVPLQTTPVRNQSQNEIENDLLGYLQHYIITNYMSDFKKAENVWTNFSQIYTYDTPFEEEAFMDETGEPLDRKDVTYKNILDYWINFIEQRRFELETPRTMDIPQTPRTITDTDSSELDGGRKSNKKKPNKASKKKYKKARKSSRNTMVRKKSRRH
jgi:hypothetical protein